MAGGWLDRARRHATEAASAVEAGFVAVADADCAAAEGNLDAAADHAHRALEIGRDADNADLAAMALQTRGRMLVALGQPREGMALLDEAMLAAVNGELDPLFTGWVYCNLLSTCHDVADLRRAGEWNDAAMRWCEQLRDGAFYPGICRLHVVELACLRGTWEAAEANARRACAELTAHDPRFAGEAYYLAGEMRRLVGDLEGAQEAFAQAHQLGRLPQPGLARVRVAQDRPDAAAKGLRLALDAGPSSPLHRAQLLAAMAEAELRLGHRDWTDATGATPPRESAARAAAAELVAIAGILDSPFLAAMAAATEGEVLLADDDAVGALARSTGIVARTAAERVGTTGRVVGLDLNEAMLAVARRLRPDLDWRHGDAGALPFPDRSFDAVTCSFGLMFFPDRGAALREMSRVGASDATVALVVPATLSDQPAYGPFVEAATRHAGPDAVSLLGTYWSCGDLDELRTLLAGSALEVVASRTRTGTVRFRSAGDFVATEVNSTRLRQRISDEVYDRIRSDAHTVLAPYTTPAGSVEVPILCHIVAARPSGP